MHLLALAHTETQLPPPAHSASLRNLFAAVYACQLDVFLFNSIFSIVCKLGNDMHTPTSGLISKRRNKIHPDKYSVKHSFILKRF